MNNVTTCNKIVMAIGGLGILFGLFMAFTGGAFQDYFYGLFIGFTLLGAAYYNNQAWKKACKEEAQEM